MKKKVVKVTISLPADLLDAAEQARQTRGESRSQFFQKAVQAFLCQTQAQEAVVRYVQGYREQPESDEEIAVVDQVGRTVLCQEPWE
ncbi:MAG: hypothetical protein D6736_08145 [Nitrospinota bacterium]|nr:MAG: hypothetical protein D6736_08145 [Nitrospinota bacterium]